MKKAQKIALIFLTMLNIMSSASATTDRRGDALQPIKPWERNFYMENNHTPTGPVPDLRPSNRTGEPLGGFNEDIMFQTK